jgi:predicted dehydrogenase
VRVAYNRRYYASTLRARQILDEDGGATSFVFEFTEWSHDVAALPLADAVKQRWLVANSSHVIDLAFFLAGWPRALDAHVAGAVPWHTAAAQFVGSGVSERGALFSYHANWAGPGRWGVELVTPKRRLIFRPMEKLHVVRLASVKIEEEPIDDALDQKHKPGLYRQVEAFLRGDSWLPTLDEQVRAMAVYERIVGG